MVEHCEILSGAEAARNLYAVAEAVCFFLPIKAHMSFWFK